MPVIRFINQTSGEDAASANWSFGDGTSLASLDATVMHTYDTTGTYYVTLDSTSLTNQTRTRTKTVTVVPIPNYYPTAAFHWVGAPVIRSNYTYTMLDDSYDATAWDYTASWGEQLYKTDAETLWHVVDRTGTGLRSTPMFRDTTNLWDASLPVWIRQTVWNEFGSDSTRIDATRGGSTSSVIPPPGP